MKLSDLPALNAFLNGLSAMLLTAAFIFIRRKNIVAHRRCMLAAVTCSILFLISYLTYHAHAGTTYFRNPPWFRPIYLTLLGTHTVLAVTIIPLIIITLTRAFKARFENHRKIARWTWPLWMYVSVTGVLIYFLLYQVFPQQKPAGSPHAIAAQAGTH
jgi:putative membrane protein